MAERLLQVGLSNSRRSTNASVGEIRDEDKQGELSIKSAALGETLAHALDEV
jgi:hypothetical protein